MQGTWRSSLVLAASFVSVACYSGFSARVPLRSSPLRSLQSSHGRPSHGPPPNNSFSFPSSETRLPMVASVPDLSLDDVRISAPAVPSVAPRDWKKDGVHASGMNYKALRNEAEDFPTAGQVKAVIPREVSRNSTGALSFFCYAGRLLLTLPTLDTGVRAGHHEILVFPCNIGGLDWTLRFLGGRGGWGRNTHESAVVGAALGVLRDRDRDGRDGKLGFGSRVRSRGE